MSKRDHIKEILGLAIGATIDFAKDEITDRIHGIEDAMIKDINDITDRLDAIESRLPATGEQPPPPEPAVVAEPDIVKSMWDRLLRLSRALAEIRDTSPTFRDPENQIYRIKAIASGALGAFGPGAAPIPPLDDTAEVKRLRDALREIRDTPIKTAASDLILVIRMRDIAAKAIDE